MRTIFMRKTNRVRNSYADKIFDVCNTLLMIVLFVIFVWPLWFVFIASFSDPYAVGRGEVLLFPKGLTLAGYELMMNFKQLWVGYGNTIFYTAVGTFLNLVMTVCCAYPLANKDFLPRKVLLALFMVTMYFSGGLIPNYLVVKQIGILNTRWAMIFPGLISVYNCLIVRTYFMNSIPGELQEAATLDGANAAQYLWKVVLPLSKPVLAVVGLYYLVGHWNDYYNALIYLYDLDLMPLQSVLRDLLMSVQALMANTEGNLDSATMEIMFQRSISMKYCVIIAAAVPVLCIYPFIQKFFVKGMMIGSVKG